ncbi:uncharacterized protein LOC128624462 isoform X1 [Ictalurus furcatus]|uniref:uncharacterized protein LOC128624462 isoform X1 n=1 Tax=Ictalurus furcatus TaxID=66913 RepID=UPI00234FCF1C|nr:uncharacterized protein LOC128624462 isoform X1 [Ictalurus furcatus]
MKNWILREIACAAGLFVLSAGAGYCVYRRLRRGIAPPENIQPPHEPENVLGDTVDTPSVLQVVEQNLDLLPTEPHDEPSAVILEKEESFLELDVPFIREHLLERGVTDIGLKLCALRKAFSTLLASIHNQNFLFVVGKKIVMRLAAANNQDVVGVQLAYESLIQFLRSPPNQESIVTELFGAQLHHYNFMDMFYELLIFRYVTNDSAPEACEGGFLEGLFAFISMWNPDEWEPAAELYFTMLIDQLTVLCEVLFSQPLELYSDPAALASPVSQLLWQHVPLMMDMLEKL